MGNPTLPLPPVDRDIAMKFIAARRSPEKSDVQEQLFEKLKANETVRKKLMGAFQYALDNIRATYPDLVKPKEDIVPNAEWRKAGYDVIADENEALGLDGR
ncbi:hypothetical protein [Methylocystis sp. S23]